MLYKVRCKCLGLRKVRRKNSVAEKVVVQYVDVLLDAQDTDFAFPAAVAWVDGNLPMSDVAWKEIDPLSAVPITLPIEL